MYYRTYGYEQVYTVYSCSSKYVLSSISIQQVIKCSCSRFSYRPSVLSFQAFVDYRRVGLKHFLPSLVLLRKVNVLGKFFSLCGHKITQNPIFFFFFFFPMFYLLFSWVRTTKDDMTMYIGTRYVLLHACLCNRTYKVHYARVQNYYCSVAHLSTYLRLHYTRIIRYVMYEYVLCTTTMYYVVTIRIGVLKLTGWRQCRPGIRHHGRLSRNRHSDVFFDTF